MRATRKTPATTIVDECSSDDTGVGPAMASGSHVCSGNWPDLTIAAMKSALDAMINVQLDPSPDNAHAWMARMSNPFESRFDTAKSLAPKNRIAVPTSRPTSPTRTVKKALRAEWLLYASSHQ